MMMGIWEVVNKLYSCKDEIECSNANSYIIMELDKSAWQCKVLQTDLENFVGLNKQI
jgi:hypothetical protein